MALVMYGIAVVHWALALRHYLAPAGLAAHPTEFYSDEGARLDVALLALLSINVRVLMHHVKP